MIQLATVLLSSLSRVFNVSVSLSCMNNIFNISWHFKRIHLRVYSEKRQHLLMVETLYCNKKIVIFLRNMTLHLQIWKCQEMSNCSILNGNVTKPCILRIMLVRFIILLIECISKVKLFVFIIYFKKINSPLVPQDQ